VAGKLLNVRAGHERLFARAGQDQRAGVDLIGIDHGVAILLVDEGAERRGVEMPITQEVVKILYHDKSPRQTVHDLMTRDLRSEAEL